MNPGADATGAAPRTERPIHLPVMPTEVLAYLAPRDGGAYIDGTLGAGGHAALVLERSAPTGRLLGLDADPQILQVAAERLARFGERAVLAHENFARLERAARWHGFAPADGILLDLGVSSLQLDRPERGFSFQADGPLDMRMDPTQPVSAATLVNEMDERELANVIFVYGEEPRARAIARAINQERQRGRIEATAQLAAIVARVVPGGRIHPATRTFQALRIEVNRELEALEAALAAAEQVLAPGGRLVVISFHSLEDRIVKQFLARAANPCVCPPRVPVCVCGRVASFEILTRKVVTATDAEVAANPRARSAKLRAARRLPPPTPTGGRLRR